jgi:signal transduction histidine kinase
MPLPPQWLETVQRLAFCRDFPSLMEVLSRAVRETTGADGATVVIREGELCHYVEEDAIAPLWRGMRFPADACVSGQCMRERAPVAIADVRGDPRVPESAYRPTFVRGLALAPIRREDPVGALGAYWARPHQASPAELATLQALGDTAALALANVQSIRALEEAGRRKDAFMAMLAHELRGPLAPLRNALHMLGNRPDPVSLAYVHEVMERQVRHLARLVDDLLDVARITTGKIRLQLEPLDLARTVARTVEDRRLSLEAAGLALQLQLPAQTPLWITGDEVRLAQVLANLLDNACKFTPRGGMVTVVVDDASPTHATVEVRDTGSGIDPELLQRVFEPFAQAEQGLARSEGGLGLGLAVARDLLALQGARIQARSEGSGAGTSFLLTLPRTQAQAQSEAGMLQDADPEGGGMHVLVVEDNLDTAGSLRLLLEACGHRVRIAHRGEDALRLAAQAAPDVVVCDIGLPDLDGYEVARRLRAAAGEDAPRLLALTGYGTGADRARAAEAGFDAHLVKPVEPAQLLAALRGPLPA